jgi:hypothetical protein
VRTAAGDGARVVEVFLKTHADLFGITGVLLFAAFCVFAVRLCSTLKLLSVNHDRLVSPSQTQRTLG